MLKHIYKCNHVFQEKVKDRNTSNLAENRKTIYQKNGKKIKKRQGNK